MHMSRREAISLLGLGAACLAAGEKPTQPRFKIIGFVKPFQNLPLEQIADMAREVGWSGIECPVRKDGAIKPERVEDDLPQLADLLRQRDLELSVISTDVDDANDALSQR